MEYRRIKNQIVFRLELGDELISCTQRIAEKENVKLASISGIGACSKAEIGYIVLEKKAYVFKNFEGNLEILHATGNITLKEGKPFAHIHMNIADEECRSFGGHLNEAIISATFEGVMNIIDDEIQREMNDDIGIALMNICAIE